MMSLLHSYDVSARIVDIFSVQVPTSDCVLAFTLLRVDIVLKPLDLKFPIEYVSNLN